MPSRYSFYIENRGVKYMFDTVEELKEYADANSTDIESFNIRLGDHCDSLTDEQYNEFYDMDVITIMDISKLLYKPLEFENE